MRVFRCVALLLAGVVLCTARDVRAERAPTLTSRGAVLVERGSGRVLYDYNSDVPMPPASTTKILTAYLALLSDDLDRSFGVSRYASTMEPSKIYLKPGWQLRGEDLVYAVLLNSANDASVVLAEGLAGSVPSFAARMNAVAFNVGARRSQFVNPNGLPAEGHYSTARDLATILDSALRTPGFRDILSTQKTVIRPTAGSKRAIALRSHNRLLGRKDIEVVGKTGYTRAAKKCFVGAARTDNREVLVAVLGATDLWGDVERLIEYGLNGGPRPLDPSMAPLQVASAEKPARSAVPRPATRPARSVRPPLAPAKSAASAQRYHVRLASFRKLAHAQGLQKQVSRRGYKAVVERVGSRKQPAYRVSVRGFATRQAALKAARNLERYYRVDAQIIALGA